MSIITNLPLVSGSILSVDEYNLSAFTSAVNIFADPIEYEPLLLGKRSLTNPVSSIPQDFFRNFTRMSLVNYQSLPVYKNKLVSAELILSCSQIPLFNSSFTIRISIGSNINIPISSTYFEINNLAKYSTTVSHNLNAGTNTINITSLINYLTSLSSWEKNSLISLFIEEVNSPNNSLVRVAIQNSYLRLQYNPVVPFKPQNIVGTPGYKQAFVSWSPPLDNGGATILDYTVEYRTLDNNNGFVGPWMVGPSTTNTSTSVDGLVNNVKYVFRVRGRNSVGIGSYSDISLPVSPENKAAPRVSSTYNDANYSRIRLRRSTSTVWSGINPILGLGEAGYETDTRYLKVGDNITEWNNLAYVRVPNNSINFPSPPPINLSIADGEFNNGDTRIICDLTNNERLNIVGKNGITSTYSDLHKAVILSLTQTYNPIYSGSLYSPATSGKAGNVAYDDKWLYVCVANNSWKKMPIEEYWFDPSVVSVSNNSGDYPSITNISFSGSFMIMNSDGDPYPALAGHNLVNNGQTPRQGFFGSYDIRDQTYSRNFRYRGPSFSSNPQEVSHLPVGFMSNGSFFCGPRSETSQLDIFSVPSGLRFNKVFFSTYFKLDPCGGEVVSDNSYRYLHGGFLKYCWNNPLFINSNSYYGGSSFNQDNFRHPNGHSKIVGFCFDGYPVYGPYAYSDPEDSASSIVLATSSYVSKISDNHRPPNWKFDNAIVINSLNYMLSAGAFVNDFDYIEGSGILDQYNGRFSVTPEYPEGVYAYYLTFTDNTLTIPKYPYIIGQYSRQQRP